MFAAPAFAQSPLVTKIEAVGSGLLQFDSSGNATLATPTATIAAAIGVKFGTIFVPKGIATDGASTVRILWLHPNIFDPATNLGSSYDRIAQKVQLGVATYTSWIFEHEWEIAPGQWTLDIWSADGNTKLFSQVFMVVKR